MSYYKHRKLFCYFRKKINWNLRDLFLLICIVVFPFIVFNVNPFEAEVPNEYDEVNLKEGQFKRNYYVIPESKEKIPVNLSRIKTTTEKPENDMTWKNYSNIEIIYGIHSQPENFSNRLAMRQSFLGLFTKYIKGFGGKFQEI